MSAGHTVTVTPSDTHVRCVSMASCWRTRTGHCASRRPAYRRATTSPKDDVRMDLLRPTSFHTTCPFKGEASYWSADVGGRSHDGFVWAYESPIAAVAEIAGHVSFYPDRAEVTVDGEALAREGFSSVLGAVARRGAPKRSLQRWPGRSDLDPGVDRCWVRRIRRIGGVLCVCRPSGSDRMKQVGNCARQSEILRSG